MAYAEKLQHEPAGHRQYLSSVEAQTHRDHQRKEFRKAMADLRDRQLQELL